jgi:hypothetical protein
MVRPMGLTWRKRVNSSKLSVMKERFLITVCAIFLISCNKNGSNENLEQLKEKFQGKYEVISSFSEDAVDLNMDGITSSDLLSENPEIYNSVLELRIINDNEQLFEEKWPIETIVIPRGEIFDSTKYHPTYSIFYALYSNPISCQFEDDYKSIHLLSDIQQNPTNTLINVVSITIGENETITFKTIRKMYSMNGWIITKIESRYKRFIPII